MKEKKADPKNLKELFDGFDYKKYWSGWEKNNPHKTKELDWGQPVGKEEF